MNGLEHITGYKILGFATQGSKGDDEHRLRALLGNLPVNYYPFEKQKKYRNLWKILSHIRSEQPQLVVMEGTGIAGGMAVILGRILYRTPYIVSSGDSVGPFIAQRHPTLGFLFNAYEKLLYKRSIGFIGWTPYLTGRALTFGSPYAMTAPGWAPFELQPEDRRQARATVRARLGIPEDHIVIGLVGSLNWNKRVGYCYGYELVRAMQSVEREDVTVIIVGDGSGMDHLERLNKKNNVVLTGRVARDEVPVYLAAMDAASLPQSVDQVGSFRYTTKVSEYLSLALPIITGTIPMAYDLDSRWFYKIYGDQPWSAQYINGLSKWISGVTQDELKERASSIPPFIPHFNKTEQVSKVTEFVQDIIQHVHSR